MQNFSFRMEEAAMDKEERLKQQIEAYQPFNLQEEQDRAEILRQFETAEHIMSRENRNAHVTVFSLDCEFGSDKGADGISQSLSILGMAGRPCRWRG